MPNITTSKGMLRVEDVSLKHPRRQSEVAKEIAKERGITHDVSIPVPVSVTPESIQTFLTNKAENTTNEDEKKVFNLLVKWVDELFDLRKKVIALEAKLPKEFDDVDEGDTME